MATGTTRRTGTTEYRQPQVRTIIIKILAYQKLDTAVFNTSVTVTASTNITIFRIENSKATLQLQGLIVDTST